MAEIQFRGGVLDAVGCVSDGWNFLRQKYWLYFGILFVALAGLAILGLIPFVALFLSGPVYVGIYRTFLLDMRGEPVNFGTMFSGFNKFITAMVVGLLQLFPQIVLQVVQLTMNLGQMFLGRVGLPAGRIPVDAMTAQLPTAFIIAVLVYIVVSAVWSFVFFFALQFVADHEAGPIEAIVFSVRAAFGNFGRLIFLILIEIGLGILGALACGIGILFVMPLVFAANAFAYRQVFPDLRQFQNLPPHPSAYGGEYGRGL